MRMTHQYAKILDAALLSFSHHPIDADELFAKQLPFDGEIIDFLLSDGSIKRNGRNFEITYKGRMRIDGNGFARERRIQVGTYTASIVAAVCSVLTVLAYLIDKFLLG